MYTHSIPAAFRWRLVLLLLFSLAVSGTSHTFAADVSDSAPWRENLCADGGGVWQARFAIDFTNEASEPFVGKTIPVEVKIPNVMARSVRVTNAEGSEILFELLKEDGTAEHEAKLSDRWTVIIPVDCEPKASARYYVYYDNPSAWVLPDWFTAKTRPGNASMETGNGFPKTAPDDWSFDSASADRRCVWTDETAHTGARSVKTVVDEGADKSWIAARQGGVQVQPGLRYRFSAWTKAQNVKGNCGWYVHVGNAKQYMIASPMLNAGSGTFDWRQTSVEFTVPAEADQISFGTVLYGTGTAWYDDCLLELVADQGQESVSGSPYRVGAVERCPWKVYPAAKGKNSAAGNNSEANKKSRTASLIVLNKVSEAVQSAVSLKTQLLERRWNCIITDDSLEFIDASGATVPYTLWNDTIFFRPTLKPSGYNTILVREKRFVPASGDVLSAAQQTNDFAFPGTSQSEAAAKPEYQTNQQPLPDALSKENLVVNGDLEGELASDPNSQKGIPTGWTRDAETTGISFAVVDPNFPLLGKRCLQMKSESGVNPNWKGWRQAVKVKPNRTYLVGIWMACDAPDGGSFQLHVHLRTKKGELDPQNGMQGVGPAISGKSGWKLLTGLIKTSAVTDTLQLHLTANASGTVWHDGVFVLETNSASVQAFSGGATGVFAVPAIVKVFEDSTFNEQDKLVNKPAVVRMAKNEWETVQFALRPAKSEVVRMKLEPPTLAGKKAGNGKSDSDSKNVLDAQLNVVGNVPVDFPTSYYSSRTAKWFRKVPVSGGNCDGWKGIWPDPLIPVNTNGTDHFPNLNSDGRLDSAALADRVWGSQSDCEIIAWHGKTGRLPLVADQTRALQVIVKTNAQTEPGTYRGAVVLESTDSGTAVCRLPFTVAVYNIELSDRPACAAIYDVRFGFGNGWTKQGGERTRQTIEFMADRRISPDTVPASPKFTYDKATGKTTADWTEFDEACDWYFNKLGIKYSYTPNGLFYCFGWGLPPRKYVGEDPYEGEYPYPNVDRSQLRPEYKKAYQARLKLFWDHLKEKGWQDRFVLYISDEPFYSEPQIIEQMKALCTMIHDVDPTIPIYSSTWRHVPEWDGYITVWGVGHYGIVPVEQLERTHQRGDQIWWTTDGQMCLDTPYCAVERLLPYFCFKYGANAYEFWGAAWLTYNPYRYGWHSYIHQSDKPGNEYWVRYPNGDGFLIYPDKAIGADTLLSSVRLEQAREGVEDAAYLQILKNRIGYWSKRTQLTTDEQAKFARAQAALDAAMALVQIPNAGGRFSTRNLAQPEKVDEAKKAILDAIIELK